MGKKYFAWSFDDGLEQDRKIVEILKKYNMGATFHLNSGLFGDKTYEGRIGNLGMTEVPAEKFNPHKKHLLPYVPHFRVEKAEAKELYKGFEIASHTAHHINLLSCDEGTRRKEITEDVAALSDVFWQTVTGFAYPYGVGAKKCRAIVKDAGVTYARTVGTAKDFSFPSDPLALPMTGWHLKKDTMTKVQAFLGADAKDGDLFFLMFAHGYEFDFGTKESNWEKFEKICTLVSSHPDVICCSVGDAFRMHENKAPVYDPDRSGI